MNRRRTKLSPERLAEITRYATALRVKMKLRCGHEDPGPGVLQSTAVIAGYPDTMVRVALHPALSGEGSFYDVDSAALSLVIANGLVTNQARLSKHRFVEAAI
jgi:hypothetical protein